MIKTTIKDVLKRSFFNTKDKEKPILCQGEFNKIDIILPAYINMTNPRFIEIENSIYAGLIVVNYYRDQTELILKSLVETNVNMNISIFYEKQDTYKTIKELTYNIGNVGVEYKDGKQNREDIDIVAFTYNDAKYIRKEMQINNEELYYLYIYINVIAQNENELEHNLNKIEGIVQSKGMLTKRANFREEQLFLSTLPFMQNHKDLKNVSKRNILTSGLLSTYPFISSTIFDEKGIYIGKNIYNNSLVFLDRFDSQKYKNANMCVFGTSGAGKSYFTKLMIIRQRLYGIEQFVIDPEREYLSVCKELNGTEIKIGPSSNNYINVFDIRKESIEDNNTGYLATKITKLLGFFNLVFGELNEEERAILEEKVIETYALKGITFDDDSLYKKAKNKREKRIFKTSFDMPILEDLYKVLEKDPSTVKFKTKLLPFVKGSLNFFNKQTNVKLNNKLIVADVYELGEENLKFGMYIFTEYFWDRIKKERRKQKTIYLDEIWRLIGVTSNKEVASFIYKIFKTIRKYGGSGVAITQDVSDLFSLEKGNYGKSILNNSSIKSFFSLEEENIRILSQNINLTENEKIEIKSLKKGECLMFVGEDHILTKIESSKLEHKIIDETSKNL